jgi:hypothetical protein
LKGKELVFPEFPVISGARKKSHLACNHEAHIAPYLWRRGSAISSKLSYHAPAAPPMLAAQAAFPSGPLASFQEKFDQ